MSYTISKKKSPKIFFLAVFIIIFSILLSKWIYKFNLVNPVNSENSEKIIFHIKTNEKLKKIASELKSSNIIRSKYVFYNYIKKNNYDTKIQAGSFILTKNINIPEIVNILTSEAESEIAFLIPEGYNIKKIDQKLSELELINQGELISLSAKYPNKKKYPFLKNTESLEGFLFPDTYFINPKTFNLENFVQKLLDNFNQKAFSYFPNIPNEKLYKSLIMASIIEKEVSTKNDQPIVSGILWKRMENNWTIGADATLLYILNKNTISGQDLKIDSPYNTRLNKGLPPTPICNPGINAIKASLEPEDTKYWFYLTPPNSNEVIYAKTNEEHNKNKQKYLE